MFCESDSQPPVGLLFGLRTMQDVLPMCLTTHFAGSAHSYVVLSSAGSTAAALNYVGTMSAVLLVAISAGYRVERIQRRRWMWFQHLDSTLESSKDASILDLRDRCIRTESLFSSLRVTPKATI